MKRASVIVLLVLLALMAVGPLGPAPVAAASRVAPKVAIDRRSGRRDDALLHQPRDQAAAAAAEVHPERRQGLLPRRDVARGQAGAPGRLDRRLPRPRQRLAEPYRNELTPSTQNGMGLNPNNGREHPPVLRRGSDRQGDQAREERGRDLQPPLLRERQLRARPARGVARRRPAARRQLRRRLHPGRRRGGHRRGLHGPGLLREVDPRRQVDRRPDLARARRPTTATCSASTASGARATPPSWTPTRRRPASTARSS